MENATQTKDHAGNTWTTYLLDDGKGNGVWSQVRFLICSNGQAQVGHPNKPGQCTRNAFGFPYVTHKATRTSVGAARAEYRRLLAEGYKAV